MWNAFGSVLQPPSAMEVPIVYARLKRVKIIYVYIPIFLHSLRYLEALLDEGKRKVGLHCDSRLAKPQGLGNGSITTTLFVCNVPGSRLCPGSTKHWEVEWKWV